MDIDKFLAALEKQTTDFIKVHRMFVRTVLGWRTQSRGLVTNGKVRQEIRQYMYTLQSNLYSTVIVETKVKLANKTCNCLFKIGLLILSVSVRFDSRFTVT